MPDNKQPVVLVVGDLMLDHYIMGETSRISPEAPVPVVVVKEEFYTLGGALNVVNNLVSLGATVWAAGVLGNDKAGQFILNKLTELQVNAKAVIIEESRITTEKSRIMASNQQILRYDKEVLQSPTNVTVETIINHVKTHIDQLDIIILSDYNKGILTDDLCAQLITLAKLHNIKLLVDPKGSSYKKYCGAFLITPNKKETTEITGIDLNSNEDLITAGKKLKTELALDKVLMTLGNKGMALYDDKLHVYPTVAREVYDVTGAGDTVLAALAFGLGTHMPIDDACSFANAAAAVVVGKVGCATATQNEIADFLHINSTNDFKLVEDNSVYVLLDKLKSENKKIVFTNGCFDILHAGHVAYLQKAKQLGDVLILGLNSDDSVKKIKGEGRPVNNQLDRAKVLAGLSCIDYIIIFNEDTPYQLITTLQPDVLVKGADYKGKEVVGSDIAKEVVLIDFVEGKSTTSILDKLDKIQ